MQSTLLLRLAMANLLRSKRRSFLTMLGIIIGITSVIMVVSIGAGAQSLILGQLQERGTDQIAVLAGASDEDGPPAQALGIVVTTLTHEDGLALLNKNNVRHIKAIASYISGNDIIRWKNAERSVTFTGTTASYQEVEKVTPSIGRFFTEAEQESGAHVIVLGDTIADELFGNQDPIGEFVKLKKKSFKVIGVLEPKGSNGFEDPDSGVFIPIIAAQRDLLGVKHVSFLRMTLDDEKYVDETVEQVRATLVERHGEEDFSVRKFADLLNVLSTVTNALRFFLASVAAVALFVGGVGIMNIMLISVKEKTREIGLRKAVGARANQVLWQFLFETVFMTCIGALIGIVLGTFLSFIIAVVVQYLGYSYKFIVSLDAILLSCVVALFIGLVFGLVPARKAAGLDPIDALRYE